MSIKKFKTKNTPSCADCAINEICGEYCIGANYEINKDFFIPISKVCQMEYLKVFSIISAYMEIGVLDKLLADPHLSKTKKQQIIQIKEKIEEQNK